MSERWVLAKAKVPNVGHAVVCVPLTVAAANEWPVMSEVRGPGENVEKDAKALQGRPTTTVDSPREQAPAANAETSEDQAGPEAHEKVSGDPPDAPAVESPTVKAPTVDAPAGPQAIG